MINQSFIDVVNKIKSDILAGNFIDESPDSWIWRAMRGQHISLHNSLRNAMFHSSCTDEEFTEMSDVRDIRERKLFVFRANLWNDGLEDL